MIPRRRASVVLVHEGQLLAVALEDPKTRVTRLFLPGGAIENDETPPAAAARETLEETGYEAAVVATSERSKRYPFRWNGADYDCLTYFYAARLANPGTTPRHVSDATYHRGVVWVPVAEVAERFAYDTNIYEEIAALLPSTAARYTSFAEFWPFYVREHESRANRLLHVFGTGASVLLVLIAAIRGPSWLWFLTPIVGYGCAWIGHYFVQHNRPATFTYPLWSLLGDFKMLALTCLGRMDREVAKALGSNRR